MVRVMKVLVVLKIVRKRPKKKDYGVVLLSPIQKGIITKDIFPFFTGIYYSLGKLPGRSLPMNSF